MATFILADASLDWIVEVAKGLFCLFVLLPLIIFAVIYLIAHLWTRRRQESLRQVVEQMGLTFFPNGTEDLVKDFAGFWLFSGATTVSLR